MNVRKAGIQDLGIIVEFQSQLALEDRKVVVDKLKVTEGVLHLLNHPDEGVYYIAEKESVAVGFIMVFFEWSDWRAGDMYYIETAYTLPEYRRQNVFKSLFRQAYEDARALNTAIRYIHPKASILDTDILKRLGLSESHYKILEVLLSQE